MDREGRKEQSIECSQFKNIHGVAVAPDGTTHVTDTSAKCLFKFNSKGKLELIRTDMQKP